MGDEDAGFSRLGKRELGPHAFEQHWPKRITALVSVEDTSNNVRDVVPKLARLLERDRDVETAFLCHEEAVQIHKVSGEGAHFCGYRNLQMFLLSLASFEKSSSTTVGSIDWREKKSIPWLQDMIEAAWDAGVNAHGRIQTGGIRGTRKHIGTPEAEALLLSLNIPCTGTAFQGQEACRSLFDFVEAYFAASAPTASEGRPGVHLVSRMPILLQRPRHSITVVGIERTRKGKRRLLTFDPAYRPPSMMLKPVSEVTSSGYTARRVLWRYRKAEGSLERFDMFETLTV